MSKAFRILAAIGLCANFAISADRPARAISKQQFLVLDGLLYIGKPDLTALGMTPIRGINPPTTITKDSDNPNDSEVRATLQTLKGYGGFVYLDYEIWPTFHASETEISENIAKLSRVLEIAHETVPSAKFGFYDVIPCWNYWDLVKNDQVKKKQWTDCNARINSLAQHVDIVMPSLYTFYNDPQGWDVYAAALMEAAHGYGKPVYVFLWPEFHVSNRLLKGKNIPGNFWRHELEFCKARADGIVIWGGYQEQWNENAEWWLETKGFLAGLKFQ